MKGETTIPYARKAAALLDRTALEKSGYKPDIDLNSVDYWLRVMHFESRYWSIDQLLEEQPYSNILELSSGFSFRGLALSRKRPVFYVDTDLEAVIAGKQRFVDALTAGEGPNAGTGYAGTGAGDAAAPGHYELQALNVLDADAFKKMILALYSVTSFVLVSITRTPDALPSFSS